MGQARPPKRIVVIEHEKDARDLTAALFEETELDVVEYAEWSGAMRFLEARNREVAMVFADVDAEGDAACFVDIIANRWPRIRVVLTGSEDRRDQVPVAAAYMQKPWRALELLIAAESAAGLRDPR